MSFTYEPDMLVAHLPKGMTMTCEDAPCCGCCGTGVWGNNNPAPMDNHEWFGQDRDYDEPEWDHSKGDCCESGDLNDIDEAEGTAVCAWCDAVVTYPHDPALFDNDAVNEDAAMEWGLFGDC